MLLFRILISLYLYFYTDDHNELLVSETNLKFGVNLSHASSSVRLYRHNISAGHNYSVNMLMLFVNPDWLCFECSTVQHCAALLESWSCQTEEFAQ